MSCLKNTLNLQETINDGPPSYLHIVSKMFPFDILSV